MAFVTYETNTSELQKHTVLIQNCATVHSRHTSQ